MDKESLQRLIRQKLAQADYWMITYRKERSNEARAATAFSLGQLQALESLHFNLYQQRIAGYNAEQLLEWYRELTVS